MAIIEDLGIEELTAGQQIVFAHTANNVSGVLAVACGASDTTIVLSPGGGALFPTAPFYCSIEFEVIWCLSKSGDSFIVQRGMDGTAATTHAVGNSVEMRNNAGLWTDAYNAINSVSSDVGNLATGITNKTALPPDTTFAGNTQELTHKTIDLTDASKQNVIIGTVQPDPASLPLQNLFTNGSFDEWYMNNSTTIAAGTPTSGYKQSWFSNGWIVAATNDSSVTATKDTANPDPLNPSGTNLLLNLTTVQAADWVDIHQALDSDLGNAYGVITDLSDIKKLVGAAISVSARIKLVSGSNIMARFQMLWYDGSYHALTGTPVAVTGSSYATFKFENQIPVPNQATAALIIYLSFQGVGQVAVDNLMLNVGATAVGFRAKPSIKPLGAVNHLVNGGFEIWQRGNGPFTGVGQAFHADRWNAFVTGTDTFSIQKSTGSMNMFSNACAAVTFTLGTGTQTDIRQIIKLSEDPIKSTLLTASVRIWCNTSNAVHIMLFSDGTGGNGSQYSAFHPGNSTYQTLITTQFIPGDATQVGILIRYTATCQTYIDDAMLVMGGVPADFTPLAPADDLARCHRYCRRWFASSTISLAIGQAFTTTNTAHPFMLSPRMAVAPSITISAPADWTASGAGSGGISLSSLGGSVVHPDVFTVQSGAASPGFAAGNASFLQNVNGNSFIQAEANP